MTVNNIPKAVLLVPFSSDDSSRIEVWDYVKRWLETTLDMPLYVGADTPGERFNLSLARNRAAEKAGDWDVAIIHDADTVVTGNQIREGVRIAQETGTIVYPFTERWELDAEGTRMFLDDEHSDWQSHAGRYIAGQPLGGCIIVTRELWDKVRGFDPGFVGWGHEDGAFAVACEVFSGQELQRVPGKVLHLEHNPQMTKSPDNPLYAANQKRMLKYIKAKQKPNAAELIQQLRDETADME